MKNNRLKQALVIIVPFALLFLALYLLFRQSWQQIFQQLKQVQLEWFGLAILLSGLYYLIDARSFQSVVRVLLPDFPLRGAIEQVAMGLFMNVSTFGAGIKPAQAIYLRERGADVGEGLGILILPYIFHKLTIVLYGAVGFVLCQGFIRTYFADEVQYIYLGYGLSLIICAFLLLIFLSSRFHTQCFRVLEKIPAGERYHHLIAQAKASTGGMRQQIKGVFADKKLCAQMFGLNIAKFFCWFSAAAVAFRAIGCAALPVNFWQCLVIAALVQLLIGVIPMTGGMVSSEVVFVLLFSVVAGPVAAGSAMLIFRVATYYLPVLISCFYSLLIYWRERQAHKKAVI